MHFSFTAKNTYEPNGTASWVIQAHFLYKYRQDSSLSEWIDSKFKQVQILVCYWNGLPKRKVQEEPELWNVRLFAG